MIKKLYYFQKHLSKKLYYYHKRISRCKNVNLQLFNNVIGKTNASYYKRFLIVKTEEVSISIEYINTSKNLSSLNPVSKRML